jgi:lipoyl(octanoyl) transferase
MQEWSGKSIYLHDISCVLISAQEIRDGDTDAVALYDDLAFGDRPVIGQHQHGFVLFRIQLDDRAAAHPQKLVHGNDGTAEHDGNLDLDAFDGGGHDGFHEGSRSTILSSYGFSGVNGVSLPDPLPSMTSVEWRVREGLIQYPEAVAFMEQRAADIADGRENELVWLVEHPPIYTAGTSAIDSDLLDPRFPVFRTGRGGQFTYHGPGQRVGYVMLNLKRRKADVRGFVRDLEDWLIQTLAQFGVKGERREGRVGIWVDRGDGHDDKIGAIGVRVRRWVTFHGVALNVSPDLDHFSGIVPCGVRGHGVTSLAALGIRASMADVNAAMKTAFVTVFSAAEQH